MRPAKDHTKQLPINWIHPSKRNNTVTANTSAKMILTESSCRGDGVQIMLRLINKRQAAVCPEGQC